MLLSLAILPGHFSSRVFLLPCPRSVALRCNCRMNYPPATGLLFTLSLASLFLVIAGSALLFRLRKSRRPVADKLLRPPGESLRKKLEDINDAMLLSLIAALCLPAVSSLVSQRAPLSAQVVAGALVLVIALGFFLYYVRLWRRFDLAFSGERAVGEELNKLMLDGCQVFHDLPAEKLGNIDHVIVAPSGVYAVETKTRRKRQAKASQKDYAITYDGQRVVFPHVWDTRALEQAGRNADWLGKWLSSAIGEPVTVQPVLTFPGWFVEVTGRGDVSVLNPKLIRSLVVSRGKPGLSSQTMERIVHQLRERCRDVEF